MDEYKEPEDSNKTVKKSENRDKQEDNTKEEFDRISQSEESFKSYINDILSDDIDECYSAICWTYSEFGKEIVTYDNWREFGLLNNLCEALNPEFIPTITRYSLHMICTLMEYSDFDESMKMFSDEFVDKIFTLLNERKDFQIRKQCLDIISMMLDRGPDSDHLVELLRERDFLGFLVYSIDRLPINPEPQEEPEARPSIFRRNTTKQRVLSTEEHEYSYYLIQTFCLFFNELEDEEKLENAEVISKLLPLLKPNNLSSDEENQVILESINRIFSDCEEMCKAYIDNEIIPKLIYTFEYYQDTPILRLFATILSIGGHEQLNVSFYNLLCSSILNNGIDLEFPLKIIQLLVPNYYKPMEEAGIFPSILSASLSSKFVKKERVYFTLMFCIEYMDPKEISKLFESYHIIDDLASLIDSFSDDDMKQIVQGVTNVITRMPDINTKFQDDDSFYEALEEYDSSDDKLDVMIKELEELLHPDDGD